MCIGFDDGFSEGNDCVGLANELIKGIKNIRIIGISSSEQHKSSVMQLEMLSHLNRQTPIIIATQKEGSMGAFAITCKHENIHKISTIRNNEVLVVSNIVEEMGGISQEAYDRLLLTKPIHDFAYQKTIKLTKKELKNQRGYDTKIKRKL